MSPETGKRSGSQGNIARELSFGCLHFRISSTDSKGITNLRITISDDIQDGVSSNGHNFYIPVSSAD